MEVPPCHCTDPEGRVPKQKSFSPRVFGVRGIPKNGSVVGYFVGYDCVWVREEDHDSAPGKKMRTTLTITLRETTRGLCARVGVVRLRSCSIADTYIRRTENGNKIK